MMLSYQRTLNGKKGFALDDEIKNRCTLIDEMMNLMSGNHICTINEPSATMLTPHLWFL